jgi:hypothetical protein
MFFNKVNLEHFSKNELEKAKRTKMHKVESDLSNRRDLNALNNGS